MWSWITDNFNEAALWILVRFLIILGSITSLFIFACGIFSLWNSFSNSKIFRRFRKQPNNESLSLVSQHLFLLDKGVNDLAAIVGYSLESSQQRVKTFNSDTRQNKNPSDEQLEKITTKLVDLNFVVKEIHPKIGELKDNLAKALSPQKKGDESSSLKSLENTPSSGSFIGLEILDKEQKSPRQPESIYNSTQAKIHELVGFYNEAVMQNHLRNDFVMAYSPECFDTTNAKERQFNLNLSPDFVSSSNGVFMAVKVDNLYVVVPRFGFSLKRINYSAGAIKDVFDCPGFDQDLTYSKIEVIEPAIFSRNDSRWILTQPGCLGIGQGG